MVTICSKASMEDQSFNSSSAHSNCPKVRNLLILEPSQTHEDNLNCRWYRTHNFSRTTVKVL